MKREFKFRVWSGEMMLQNVGTHPFLMIRHENEKGGLMDNIEEGCITVFNNDENLMQYTGLKDKNGKEIYEGDIVKVAKPKHFYFVERIGVVEYSVDCIIACNSYDDDNDQIIFCKIWQYDLEVIGNIYENPELLETK